MKRRGLREQIFKLLFRADFHEAAEMEEQMDLYFDSGDQTVSEEDRALIRQKVLAVMDCIPALDEGLEKTMEGWTMARVGRVEKAILRLAAYEIDHDEEVPLGVAISEAVELAKKFGQDNAASFVNGVLARYVKGRE